MALTATEEALVRQLLDEQAAILSLANNEPTITSKLGATKVNLSALTSASSITDTDLLLTRQGSTDKNVTAAILNAYVSNAAGVTAPQFDNDTSRATTAFVQRALGNFQSSVSVTADRVITSAEVGKAFIIEASTNAIVTLPLLSTVPDGASVLIKNEGGTNPSVVRTATDLIYYNGTSNTSIPMPVIDTFMLFVKRSNGWATYAVLGKAGSYGGTKVITTSQALTNADAGKAVAVSGAGGITVTLPLISTLAEGATFLVKNDSSGTVTFAANATDTNSINYSDVATSTFGPIGCDGFMIFVVSGAKWRPYGAPMRAGNFAALKAITLPYTLLASDAGKFLLVQGGVTGNITCPTNIFPGGGTVTIMPAGATDIVTLLPSVGTGFAYGGTARSSIVLSGTDTVQLACQGGSQNWLVASGGLRSSGVFDNLQSSSGYQKLPSGVIIQWGTLNSSASASVVTVFPIAFPSAAKGVYLTPAPGSGTAHSAVVELLAGPTQFSAGSFTAAGARSSIPVFWSAIGY